MAYIGKQPIVGNYQVLDALTATTTDTYALTKNSVAVFPQTPANCIVSLNGVIQAPFDSYTISGSNIVFASALTGSDSIDFITVLGDVLNVGTVSDGTIGLAKLSATGTKDATTFLRGDNTFQTIGKNTPSFLVKMTADQSLTDAVNTKVQFDDELFDTNNCYDPTTNYRFTPTVAGYYFLYASARAECGGDFLNDAIFRIQFNGGDIFRSTIVPADNVLNTQPMHVYGVALFNGTTDYAEAFINVDVTAGGTPSVGGGGRDSYFGGFKLIGT